jgi:hypothetical protein
MNAKHTPGRLEANDKRSKGGGGFSIFAGGQYIGFVSDSDAITDWEANARRLVACWNACEGLSTEALERMGTLDRARVQLDAIRSQAIAQRDELLAVVQELEESASYWSEYDVPLGIVDRLRAAIAKVTGQKGGAA